MSGYRAHLAAHVRLVILRLLAEAPEYRANSSILRDAASSMGLPVSRDIIATEIAWLEEQSLLSTETIMGGIVVATLSPRGADVAAGRAHVPGVTRPGPKG